MSLVDSYLAEERFKEANRWVNLGIDYDTACLMRVPIQDRAEILERDISLSESKARNLKIKAENMKIELEELQSFIRIKENAKKICTEKKDNEHGKNDGSNLRAGAGYTTSVPPYSTNSRDKP